MSRQRTRCRKITMFCYLLFSLCSVFLSFYNPPLSCLFLFSLVGVIKKITFSCVFSSGFQVLQSGVNLIIYENLSKAARAFRTKKVNAWWPYYA